MPRKCLTLSFFSQVLARFWLLIPLQRPWLLRTDLWGGERFRLVDQLRDVVVRIAADKTPGKKGWRALCRWPRYIWIIWIRIQCSVHHRTTCFFFSGPSCGDSKTFRWMAKLDCLLGISQIPLPWRVEVDCWRAWLAPQKVFFSRGKQTIWWFVQCGRHCSPSKVFEDLLSTCEILKPIYPRIRWRRWIHPKHTNKKLLWCPFHIFESWSIHVVHLCNRGAAVGICVLDEVGHNCASPHSHRNTLWWTNIAMENGHL